MKHLVILLYISSITLSFKYAEYSRETFIGNWVGMAEEEKIYLNFEKEGYASFGIDGEIIGGKSFDFEGEKGQMTFEVDINKTPIEVDLIIKRISTGETLTMKCIAHFINSNKMKFSLGLEDERPTSFDNDDTVVLEKVK